MTEKHYFASSVYGWGTGATAEKALANCISQCNYYPYHANVYEVPVEETAEYKINYYEPQVDGTIPLFRVTVTGKKKWTTEGHYEEGEDGKWRLRSYA